MLSDFRRTLISPLIGVALLSLSTPVLPVEESIVLPDIGDSSESFISPLQEKELGEAFFRTLHGRIPISHNPEISDYIQSLGDKLVAASDRPQQAFTFFVVLDPMINAFAGPGGYIGVNAGLMLAAESESELASVMAHEIAHVTQRHIYRSYEANQRMSIPLMAATLAAAILVGSQSPELGQAALMAGMASGQQFAINFTRNNEEEADRVGMKLLAHSAFDPRSMPAFFEKLQRASRYYGEGPPEFLRTHPVTVSRIADTQGRAEQYPYRQHNSSTRFLLLKAQLRVLTGKDPAKTLRYFQANADQGTGTQKMANQYGLALAYLSAANPAAARPILQKLVQKHPTLPWLLNALARSQLQNNRVAAALKLYTQGIARFPGDQALTLAYTRALLRTDQAGQAKDILLGHLRKQGPSAEIYYRLAEVYGKLNNQAEAHRYLAEHYFMVGRTQAAITQAKIGLKSSQGNFYLTTVLEERLKYYQAEEAEREKRKL